MISSNAPGRPARAQIMTVIQVNPISGLSKILHEVKEIYEEVPYITGYFSCQV
jgi:hypothetical protein